MFWFQTKNFFWIPVSAADYSAVKHNGNNMFLARGATIFSKEPATLINKALRKPLNGIIWKIQALLVVFICVVLFLVTVHEEHHFGFYDKL